MYLFDRQNLSGSHFWNSFCLVIKRFSNDLLALTQTRWKLPSYTQDDFPSSQSFPSSKCEGEFTLRVLSHNLWGLPIGPRLVERMTAFAKEIEKNKDKIDVVALQEAWMDYDRDTIREAAKRGGLNYSHYFHYGIGFPLWPHQCGSGIFVLSRYPIVHAMYRRYPVNGKTYKIWHGDAMAAKGCGFTRIQTPVGPVEIYTTHLVARYDPPPFPLLPPIIPIITPAPPSPLHPQTHSNQIHASASPPSSLPGFIKYTTDGVTQDEYLAHRVAQSFTLAQFVHRRLHHRFDQHQQHQATCPPLARLAESPHHEKTSDFVSRPRALSAAGRGRTSSCSDTPQSVLTIVAGDLNTPPGALCHRMVRDVARLTDCYTHVHGVDEFSVDRSDWFPLAALQKKAAKEELNVPGATIGTPDNYWSREDCSGECRLDYILFNKDDCDKKWKCSDCETYKLYVDLRTKETFRDLNQIDDKRLSEKARQKELERRKKECVPISDHWGVLTEFKFSSNGYEDKNERSDSPESGKLKLDPLRIGDKKERQSEDRANLALREGMDILMDGIVEGQDRRLRHIILGLVFLCFGLCLLWFEPLQSFGRPWWIVSRVLITLIFPFATAELVLGFISVSDEILCLRQVAMEMDLTRQMDPHWRISSWDHDGRIGWLR